VSETKNPTFFNRYFLPGFAFKAVIIGGGYATGRELVEYFLLPAGPVGGALAMLMAMVIWSVVCVITFLFARATNSEDYRTFFKNLLGPLWFIYEIAYLLFIIIILAVFGAAAGALGQAVFGWPEIVGTLCLVVGIMGFVAFGNESVEQLFKYVSFFLYGTYALFVVLALSKFGGQVLDGFAQAAPAGNWAWKGTQYAGYNIIGAVVILPVLRHLTSSKDAVVAGVLAGPLAMIPAFLFFICMVAYYPEINGQTLPSDFMLTKLGNPAFHIVFQLMIFSALLESGTGSVHAINERISGVYEARKGKVLGIAPRLGIAAVLLIGSIFLATKIGLVDLIAKGYGLLGIVFLLIFVLPLMTYGVYRLWKSRQPLPDPAI
jgi:uncharacterized membrane protein YkvI